MSTLRHLRQSRALTYLDLAALTNIPARTLAEIEHGLRQLSLGEREQLAFVLGLRPHELAVAAPMPHAPAQSATPALLALALVATLATSALQTNQHWPLPQPRSAVAQTAPVRLPLPITAPAVQALVDTLTLQHLRSQLPHEPPPLSPPLAQVPVPRPTAVTPPAFILTEAGPQGCPIQPSNGQVVITQGYAVGTHAPATVWGAVDLAVDSNGDGYAEPGATWYTPVVATHAGHVRVTLNSYPAGNHVWVEASHTPWRTGYAHLAIITVISEQYVQPGDVIGLIGSSGMSSGPHLDYQIWQGETNIDPTPLIGCANAPSL